MKLVQKPCSVAAFFVGVFTAIACAQTPPSPPQTTVHSHDVSIADYQQHLKALSILVDTCQTERNIKTCDPALVGSDDRVPLVVNSHHEQRLVRYGWLRLLLSKAEDPDPPQAKSPTPNGAQAVPRELSTTSQLLKAAKARLEGDLAQSSAPPVPSLDHAHNAPRCSRCWLALNFAICNGSRSVIPHWRSLATGSIISLKAQPTSKLAPLGLAAHSYGDSS